MQLLFDARKQTSKQAHYGVTPIYCAYEWLPILNGTHYMNVGSNECSLPTQLDSTQFQHNEQDMNQCEATKLCRHPFENLMNTHYTVLALFVVSDI